MDGAGLGGRLPLQPAAELSPNARELYDRLTGGRLGQGSPFSSRTETGELIGPFNAFLYAPAIGAGFIDFHEAEEKATALSARVREVVILTVGAVWGAAFELYAHRAVAMRVGLAPEIIDALAAGELCKELGDDERTAQCFTLELARNRAVADTTYAEAEAAFGREGLVALTLLVAAYTGTCVVLNAFAVSAPKPTFGGASR